MTYAQLIEKLAAMGVDEKEVNVRNKLFSGANSRRFISAMFRGNWIAAIALGLALSCPGHAQEQAQDEQGAGTQQQSLAHLLPAPIPVDIVEDQATAEARERREEEAAQREKDDLIAQQGMNEATQAMNDATQRMADFAYIQTWLVGTGTALLFATLFLTWQANRAAQAAVAVTRYIGKVQSEAYLTVANFSVGGGLEEHIYRQTVETGSVVISVSFLNRGLSPALLQSATVAVEIARDGAVLYEDDLSTVMEHRIVEAGGNGFVSARVPYRFLVEEDFTEMHGASMRVQVSVDYKTRFGDIDRIRYEVTKAIISTRPINPEIQVSFQNEPLSPPRVEVERIEKSKAHYEEG